MREGEPSVLEIRSQFDQSTVTQIFRSTKCLEGDGSYSSFPHVHAGETNVPHTLNDETIVEQLKPYSIVLRLKLDFLVKLHLQCYL
jgi:hypothetical protein